MTPTADEFTAVETALRGLVRALSSGRADEVLAAEAPLQAATAGLAALRASGRTLDATRVRQATRSIRIAVLECQALGYSAETLRRILIPDAGYSGARHASVPFRTLESRA